MKLSIIVPVYGVEKYVRKCILSIIEQVDDFFKEIELIIVNDGTKDKSIEQIRDLVDMHANITLINQNNQGLSMARNNGMQSAHGDYVWFIDSDDWISGDSIKTLFPYLDGLNDTIVIGAVNVTDKSQLSTHVYTKVPTTINGQETFRRGWDQMCTSVLTVYRIKFLKEHEIKFMPNVYHEDDEFCPRVSYLSQRITFIPNELYYIRRAASDGRQSITTVPNSKRASDCLKVANALLSFRNNMVVEDDIRDRFDDHICILVNNALDVITHCSDDEAKKFNIEYEGKYHHLNKILARGRIKNKLEALIFKLLSHNVIGAYSFIQHFNPRNWK